MQCAREGGVVLVIVDGLSDVSLPCLSNCTPLTASPLPCLNTLARNGQCGLMDPVAPGVACGSDTAHLALFGVEPRDCYRGRGAFEAIGDGVEMRVGDVAFKCNFAWMDEKTGVVVRRCANSMKEFADTAQKLCRKLDGLEVPGFPDVEVGVKHAMKHRCSVRLRGRNGLRLCDSVTGTDPLVDGEALLKSRAINPDNSAAVQTAAVINAVSIALQKKLKDVYSEVTWKERDEPRSNVVLLRGASETIDVKDSFQDLHGMRAFLIAPTKIIAGVGTTVGLPILHVDGATGDYRTSFVNKATACVSAMLQRKRGMEASSPWHYDLGIVHIKAVDDAGHDGNLSRKLKHMGDVDSMLTQIANGLIAGGRRHVRLVVTGDHTTPVGFKEHSCEPVLCIVAPVGFAADVRFAGDEESGWVSDHVTRFDEADVGSHGCMGRFKGLELMSLIRHHVTGFS